MKKILRQESNVITWSSQVNSNINNKNNNNRSEHLPFFNAIYSSYCLFRCAVYIVDHKLLPKVCLIKKMIIGCQPRQINRYRDIFQESSWI